MSSKRILIGICALVYLISVSACGNSAEDISDSPAEPVVNTVTSDAAPIPETETLAETQPVQPVQDGIFTLNPSSGVFVKDAGNYETYLDGFQFPDNYRIFMSCGQAPLDITIGTDGKTDIVNLQFPENNNLDYTVYMTDTDAYSDMYFSGTAIKSKHAVIENKYNMYDVSDYMDRLNITKAAFKYVEYNGEETIDGIVCDSLACKMFNNNTESDCTFYFTKDGEYVKTTLFCPESNDTGYIEPVSEITIPDLTTEETGAKSIAAECLDLIRNGFTITPQTQETTEPPTEGENPIYSMKGSEIHYYSETVETPSGTKTRGRIVPEGITVTKSPAPEDTPEGEVLTDYLVFQDYNNTKGTFVGMYWATHIEYISDTEVIYTEYNFRDKEQGKEYDRWCLDSQVNNKILTMKFEYYVKGGRYYITNVISHDLTPMK
ncbi:MAG: hypothetical protein IKP69_02100 [Oscillospiraceae bacterium]|nr:hypothetical protein [Oscillospiraceae bacterium]